MSVHQFRSSLSLPNLTYNLDRVSSGLYQQCSACYLCAAVCTVDQHEVAKSLNPLSYSPKFGPEGQVGGK